MQGIINQLLQILIKLFFKPILIEHKDKYLNKVINLYKKDGFTAIFSKIRIWDSPFVEVEKLIPKKSVILDLGCGDGIFSNYLALKSSKRNVVGIELNTNRVEDAQKGIKNTRFINSNALTAKFVKADTILMFHLLHHLPAKEDQTKLIRKCVSFLNKNGKIIIVEVDNKPMHKFLFSHFIDKIIVPILFEKKLYDPSINYRTRDEWVKLLNSFHLRTKVKKADNGKPFSHIIIESFK